MKKLYKELELLNHLLMKHLKVLKYKNATDQVAQTSILGGKYRGAFASFIILCVFGAIVSVIWFGTTQVLFKLSRNRWSS